MTLSLGSGQATKWCVCVCVVSLFHGLHSATWNATNQACTFYVPAWLILLRQFVIHKQPSASQDSCVTVINIGNKEHLSICLYVHCPLTLCSSKLHSKHVHAAEWLR